MKEDKQEILRKLLELLQATRNLGDIIALDLETVSNGLFAQYAVAKFPDDVNIWISITGDSGTAIIEDVMRGLSERYK